MDVVRPRWSSSSFLMYAGAFVVLSAMIVLLGWLATEHSDGGFFGWSLLVWAVIGVVAVGFELSGERVAAGLFAFVSLVALSVAAGAFETLINILDEPSGGLFEGFRWALLLLALIIITAGFILLARFRFPLLVLPVAAVSWFFLVDLVSGGGTWSAIVSIFVGLFFMLVGAGADRAYGFWIHVVAGLAIGGAFLYMWNSATWEWILIGLIALVYFLFAGALDRSSYAVLGGIGLFLAWSYFVEKWTDAEVSNPVFEGVDTPGFSSDNGEPNVWSAALLYALFGLVLVAIGLWLERRKPAEPGVTAA
ncbi:MAG: hypothetical protein ACRDO9_05955 [Gaiellales bacterium]